MRAPSGGIAEEIVPRSLKQLIATDPAEQDEPRRRPRRAKRLRRRN